MNPVRRIISFILAVALICVGVLGIVDLFFFAHAWRGWMVIGAATMVTLGGVWLWEDFINAKPEGHIKQPKS